MHAEAHKKIFESTEQFTSDGKVYSVKIRAFTLVDEHESEAKVDTNIIALEYETSYTIEHDSCCSLHNKHQEREIVSHTIIHVKVEDIEQIYSAFTDQVLGKVSAERMRITANKQALYSSLFSHKSFIENITLDPDKRVMFCKQVLKGNKNADNLLRMILGGCVTEIHERFHEV